MDELNLNNEFIKASEALIEGCIEHPDTKSLLENVYNFHKGNIFHYAEIQLGLAKSLDFNLENEALNNFQTQIHNVVSLAYQILQVHVNQCTQTHEDGACLVGKINYLRINTNLFSHSSTLPIAHALNFSGRIVPTKLPRGTKIYRIIGKNRFGHWWLENKPISRTTWRSESAVSETWNDGTQCVEYELVNDLTVWRGIAASQAVPMSPSNCYLKGGEYQLWLDPTNLSRKNDVKKWP